jgi:hypothetical protein
MCYAASLCITSSFYSSFSTPSSNGNIALYYVKCNI